MIRIWISLIFTSISLNLMAAETPAPLKDEIVESEKQIVIGGKQLDYKTITGTMVVKDDNSKDKATVFFVAYVKQGIEDYHNRPVMFCFNGGPGSSSVWLHLGAFGPRVVEMDGVKFDSPPYDLRDNPETLLTDTDLVFIDPVSTGYSRPAPDVDVKEFHGVDEDIASVGSFIRLWTTRYGRWESPKYLAGESYGSTRAAKLADHLHDKYGMYMNGVILISSILNFQTLKDDNGGNDLPYILYLPSYAATAWYHKRLSEDLQNRTLDDLLAEVESFAINQYTFALMKGDLLSSDEKQQIVKKLSDYTGLSEDYLNKSNLRVSQPEFSVELLRKEKKVVGRFDGRFVGDVFDPICTTFEYDPSKEAVFGAFTAAFYQYVTRELQWKNDREYRVLANVWPWSYNSANNTYLNVATDLREVMIKNPKLRILVANGYYDLATTYYSNVYTFGHFNLPGALQKNIHMTYYPGGHMMYIDQDLLIKLNQDIKQFLNKE